MLYLLFQIYIRSACSTKQRQPNEPKEWENQWELITTKAFTGNN